jgi:hypothetical protein
MSSASSSSSNPFVNTTGIERAREQSSGVKMYLLAAYYLAMANLSLTTMLGGVVVVAIGALVLDGLHAVFAGMFGIFGVSFVVLGALSYALLWANKLYAMYTE